MASLKLGIRIVYFLAGNRSLNFVSCLSFGGVFGLGLADPVEYWFILFCCWVEPLREVGCTGVFLIFVG